MDRTAIFVDAGYFFAQSAIALSGRKLPRRMLDLDAARLVDALKSFAAAIAPDTRLLRIYWYDGAIDGARLTPHQAAIAHQNDVKLRLGFVNHQGHQKGVDSLIVTDIIELARLRSICDAVLLSGDDDIRIGMQIAQNYGVRVHLLGVSPSFASQSQQLLLEADTKTEWRAEQISAFIGVREESAETGDAEAGAHIGHHAVGPWPHPAAGAGGAPPLEDDEDMLRIDDCAHAFVQGMTDGELTSVLAYWETGRGVPPDIDRRLLPVCRTALERPLDRDEVRHMRACFQDYVRERTGQL